ncbi:chorismate synthase [Anoxybacter fermentans]|uniref:Chorismate synthase n=1 Tax=Anoxybacter fermentans TaxID=1323375 RepID=A0A3Q9HSA6_9FIRM|nr:chorismate synthase [Anoxybacter fermentans]AZR74180.1 chorismate synthase [Anoxybacter fermentans]
MFTYLTAGESHGKMLTAIIKKVPSGLSLTAEMINKELARRQRGYGRGGRMKIEKDRVQITSGVRHGLTLGSPISLIIKNKDWENWQDVMAVEPLADEEHQIEPMTNPRPGHADLPGAIKYNTRDLRNILERASARETAIRTAVGAVCRQFLRQFGIEIFSHVVQIGDIKAPTWGELTDKKGEIVVTDNKAIKNFFAQVEKSALRCGNPAIEEKMIHLIDTWRDAGDSVGGVFEIVVTGLPVGLGSYVQWDERLDGKLAQALISIQGIKGVEFGLGFSGAGMPGSKVHDQIYYQASSNGGKFYRTTNRAGGLEGGMTNGEPLIIRAAMKPIPTLMNPLHSVDILTKREIFASKERADVCAVPAASVVGEGVVAIVLAQVFAAKFGGDSMAEIRHNYKQYQAYVRSF